MPLLHGPMGEDGTVQGLLGAGRRRLRRIRRARLGAGDGQGDGQAGARRQWHPAGPIPGRARAPRSVPAWPATLADELGLPCFVKPSNMGSSVGVTKAHDVEELDDAIDYALTYDEWVVVEEAVVGREIEVAVLGGVDPVASGAGEIIPGEEFYSYEDKYVTDGAQLLVPAPLSAADTERVRSLAVDVFTATALRRARPGRLLLRGRRAWLPLQRGQHDAGLHPDLDVPEAVAGRRRFLPGADRSPRRAGDRTQDTAPAQHQALNADTVGSMATTGTSTLPLGRRRPTSRCPAPTEPTRSIERAGRSAGHAGRLRLQPLPVRQARRHRLGRGRQAVDRRGRRRRGDQQQRRRAVPRGPSRADGRAGDGHGDGRFPYLVDADQTAALAYGAVCTPDFFLFDGAGMLVYRGRFDGSTPGNDVPLTGDELDAAVAALVGRRRRTAPTSARASAAASSGSPATNRADSRRLFVSARTIVSRRLTETFTARGRRAGRRAARRGGDAGRRCSASTRRRGAPPGRWRCR